VAFVTCDFAIDMVGRVEFERFLLVGRGLLIDRDCAYDRAGKNYLR